MKLKASILSLILSTSLSVSATENSANQNLLLSCQTLITNPKDNTQACHFYIQGFLASALAIDASIVDKQSKKKYQHYRTKGRTSPHKFNHFCIPEHKPAADVIAEVAKQIPDNIQDMKTLRDNVFNTLHSQYPCSNMEST